MAPPTPQRLGSAPAEPWRSSGVGVRLERSERVAMITVDRPDDQNRFTRDVLLALQEIVDQLAGDAETQAVVLTGGGTTFFSMGILNPAVRASYTQEQILELVRAATSAWPPPMRPPRCRRRCGAASPAPAVRCACRCWWAARARWS